ncbi:MAG: competence/damage-inducible protein A [Candidatus Firestonebacteria bacterium]|nr:competence/damage-inducible protein A [Candidatus Firestonebacteria bacterium]
MQIELVIIGSELLTGQIRDKNGPFLCERLRQTGFEVSYISIVKDNTESLEQVIREASSRSDIIIITGGLGPTIDDITKKVIARVFKKPLILNESVLKEIMKKDTPANSTQALIPQGAKIIQNKYGTAPGLLLTQGNKRIFALPGVPQEMKQMAEDFVFPYIISLNSGLAKYYIKSRKIWFTGLPEIEIDEKIQDLFNNDNEVQISILPEVINIALEIIVKSEDISSADRKLNYYETRCKKIFGSSIFGYDNETIEKVIGEILISKKYTISFAESCTGGLISNRITNVPGSSEYFKGSVIAYDNTIKEKVLKISKNYLMRYGAVSSIIAKEMASHIRKYFMTDIGLGVTGIAGPGGGTKTKPVGLVYIAISTENDTVCEKFLFNGERELIKQKTADNALRMLREALIKDSVSGVNYEQRKYKNVYCCRY